MKARWTMIAMMGVLMAVAVFIVAALSDTQPELTFQNPETDVADHPQTTTQSETEQQSEMEEPAMKELYQAHTPENIKAMWLSQFDITLMCVLDGEQRNEDEYRARVSLLVSRLVYMKINTAFVQMRPKGDSMYPSDIFPASAYAVGVLDGKFKYDPISILIEELKRAEISPHAWINPLRLMSESELSRLNKKYIISEWYRDRYDFISVVDGVAYLDPYYEETRALVADGVCEIIEKYGVDGIHIDDYFYPTASASFDAFKNFAQRGKVFKDTVRSFCED